MKYIFTTVLHFLNLKNLHRRGKLIDGGMRISNNSPIVEDVLRSDIFRQNAGWHSIQEFTSATYIYINGNFDDLKSSSLRGHSDYEYTYYFLRQAQSFIDELWFIKDNSIYVRDGFLIVYDKNIEDGAIYKASFSAINSKVNGKIEETIFDDDNIERAIKEYKKEPFPNIDGYIEGGKVPSNEIFKMGSLRQERAFYFILSARQNSNLHMKIASYCSALECLFTTGDTQISHRIAERLSIMLGKNSVERKEIYKFSKKAYKVRSSIFHGQAIGLEDEKLISITSRLKDYLSLLLQSNNSVFTLSNKEMDDYFSEKVTKI